MSDVDQCSTCGCPTRCAEGAYEAVVAERDALAARLETEQVDHELVEFPDSSRTRRVLVRLGEALDATGGSATHEDRMLELCRLITALSRTLTTGGRDCD